MSSNCMFHSHKLPVLPETEVFFRFNDINITLQHTVYELGDQNVLGTNTRIKYAEITCSGSYETVSRS